MKEKEKRKKKMNEMKETKGIHGGSFASSRFVSLLIFLCVSYVCGIFLGVYFFSFCSL